MYAQVIRCQGIRTQYVVFKLEMSGGSGSCEFQMAANKLKTIGFSP